MPIYKGSNNQSLVYKGNSVITNVYKGSTLVYRLGFDPVTFTANGTWTVPAGIKQIRVDCVAAQGYTNGSYIGGFGGRVQCVLNVTPGQILNIVVGSIPTYSAALVYNASDIRINGTEYSNRIIVAGGGGNASICTRSPSGSGGGACGGLTGANGINCDRTVAGGGGTQTSGGARGYTTDTGGTTGAGYGNVGSFGLGGQGVGGSQAHGGSAQSGSGGAGWYGGGSGGTYEYFGWWTAGGGGGSSYTNQTLCSEVVHTQGYRAGSGYVTISMV